MLLFLVLSWSQTTAQEPTILDIKGEWNIIAVESEFEFKIKNMWLFNVKGTMDVSDGTINFNKMNTDNFVSLTIDPSTINTGNDKRDDHLKSEDFFYVSEYPTIKFGGGEVVASDVKNSDYMVKGTLTIRGVTHQKNIPISEITYINGSKDKIKITGKVNVDRQKFEIDYSGMVIADEAKVTYTIVAER
jgi:polyisoprenoid-binding protein YceI